MPASPEQQRFEQRLAELAPRARVRRMLRMGSGSRPDVAVVVIDGCQWVVKDHQGCDPWFAKWLGPILARREARALELLSGLEGVPKMVRMLDRRAIAMSWIDARPYRQRTAGDQVWREFFTDMERLISQMHSCGVAHCDLRSPDNTLITPQGRPVVVDFVASYTRGGYWNPVSRWLFGRFCSVDWSALDKQKRTVCPQLLDASARRLSREGVIGWLARNFGVMVRNIARMLFTRSGRR